ncbi:MAG TPA: hypothetical protein VF192_01340 [Longimicrobiales bacterium]
MTPPGNKLEGAPADAPPRYEGQERFVDGDFQVTSWTPELALAALGAEDMPRSDQEVMAQDAMESALLPPAAIEALRKGGYVSKT